MSNTKVTTIKHGTESEHVGDIGGIPPYAVSAWAEDKTVEELHAELERRKDVARAEGQLLDHEYTTLEWIAAERRLLRGRSAADIAADHTAEERKASSEAMTAYYVAVSATKDVKEAHEAAVRARIEAGSTFGASFTPADERKLLDAIRAAKIDVEHARDLEGEALVRMNRVKADIERASQARRREAQAGINRAAFVANVTAAGGKVDEKDLDRHYPRPGILTSMVRRVTSRRKR
jgi:hypothetical protein